MEASAAGLAASDAGEGQQQQGEQQPDGQQTAQQPDLSALASQLQDVPAQLEQMRAWMEQSQTPAQDPAAAEEPATDLSFVDPESPSYDPQRAAEQLLEVLGKQQQDAVSQAVAPLQSALSEMQAARDADYLAQEFPDLQNPDTADAVLKATAEWVQAAGLPPETASNMQVVRAVYMMGRAAELNATEQSGGEQQAATLEGAGGASPGGTPGGLTAESIVNGPGARNPLPFG